MPHDHCKAENRVVIRYAHHKAFLFTHPRTRRTNDKRRYVAWRSCGRSELVSRVHPWASPLRAFEHCVRRTAPLEYGSAVRSTILHRHFATYTILPLHLAPLRTRQSTYTYTQSMHVEVSVSVQTCTAIYNEPLPYRVRCHLPRCQATCRNGRNAKAAPVRSQQLELALRTRLPTRSRARTPIYSTHGTSLRPVWQPGQAQGRDHRGASLWFPYRV